MASVGDTEAPAGHRSVAEWLSAGQAALDAGQFAEAATAFARVQDATPRDIAVALMVANAWRLAGDTVRARSALQRACTPEARHAAAALYELGGALLAVGAPNDALRCFEEVARVRPRDPVVIGALASATRATGDPQRAWSMLQRTVTPATSEPALLLTAAQIRHALGDLTGARFWLARAEAVRPAHGPTRLQRAFTSLIEGASADGWADFEHRGVPSPAAGTRAWRGEPLDGAAIRVLAEQGVGDLFHFLRFVPSLHARGASRVLVECPPGARSLLAASGFEAIDRGDRVDTEWSVPIMSLPLYLGTDTETSSERIPYLRAGRTAESAQAAAPSGTGAPLRLGLVWKGNPAFLATNLRDFDRALVPALLEFPGVHWTSLQYGEPVPASSTNVSTPQLSADWLDTARLLETLDGVVTVDTAIAHLAGAMGRPVYLLLPFTPDWRWGLGHDRTPWYPSALLFRQTKPRDWRSVVQRLRKTLAVPVR
jgi:Flp pilus assembly protein TadD